MRRKLNKEAERQVTTETEANLNTSEDEQRAVSDHGVTTSRSNNSKDDSVASPKES